VGEEHPDPIIKRLAEREPVVLVSAFERWHRRALIGLLVIDLGLTGILLTYVERNHRVVDDIVEMIDQAKALDCRGLVLEGVELDPEGACYDPNVLRYYDPQTGQSR
jgi:hypothetical protein